MNDEKIANTIVTDFQSRRKHASELDVSVDMSPVTQNEMNEWFASLETKNIDV